VLNQAISPIDPPAIVRKEKGEMNKMNDEEKKQKKKKGKLFGDPLVTLDD